MSSSIIASVTMVEFELYKSLTLAYYQIYHITCGMMTTMVVIQRLPMSMTMSMQLCTQGRFLRQSCVLKTIEILPDGSITLSRTIPPLAGAISQISVDFIANMTVRSPHILPLFGVNDFYGISYSIDSPNRKSLGKNRHHYDSR